MSVEWTKSEPEFSRALESAFLEVQVNHCTVFSFARVNSTMNVAAELMKSSERAELVKQYQAFRTGDDASWAIFSEEQTKGRGREGRSWSSGKSDGVYATFVFFPGKLPHSVAGLSLAAGIAVVRAVADLGVEAKHKWPNDVFAKGPGGEWKKISGILVDLSSSSNGALEGVLVGIGVNLEPPGLPEAVSLREILGAAPSYCQLAAALTLKLQDVCREFFVRGLPPFIEEWERTSLIVGKNVRVTGPSGELKGVVLGIQTDGALRISAGGREERIYNASIRLE